MLYKFIALLAIVLSNNIYCQDWEWQSPIPQGNTLRAVYFINKDTGFLAGEKGIILSTYDGGDTWNFYYSDYRDNHRDICFTDNQNGYIVGSMGNILITNDCGKTWKRNRQGYTDFYGIDFLTSKIGFIVGASGTLLKTNDGGVSWTKTISGSYNLRKVCFVDSMIGYAVGEGHTVRKTIDGGDTWNYSNSPMISTIEVLVDVHFFNSNTGIVVTNSGDIFKTTSGGNDWYLVQKTYTGITSLFFVDNNLGYCTNFWGGIFKTTNGGNYWTEVRSNGYSEEYGLNAVYGFDDSLVYTVGNHGALYKSDNKGISWQPVLSRSMDDLNCISFYDHENGIAVGNKGVIYKTKNSGEKWEFAYYSSANHMKSVNLIYPGTGFIVGSQGLILKTINGGSSWNDLTFNNTTNYNCVKNIDKDTAYIVGNKGLIIKTNDGGLNWLQQTSGTLNNLYSVSFHGGSIGFAVGAGGTILITKNGGLNWNTQLSGVSQDLTGVQCLNDSTVFISASSSHILKTTDQGLTWKVTNLGSGMKLNSIFMSDMNIGCAVGNEGYIYATTDGGKTWSGVYNETHTWENLFSVSTNESYDMYAVGAFGTILKRSCQIVDELEVSKDSFRVCEGTKSLSISIDKISNADTYQWIISKGLSGVSTTNSIDLIIDKDFKEGFIYVQGKNKCSSSNIGKIHLTTILKSYHDTTISACKSYTSPSGKYLWTSTGIYRDTILNASGCDSIININLHIKAGSSGKDIITTCDSYTWIDGITYTESNNTATYKLTNIHGCDSVVLLNLTINSITDEVEKSNDTLKSLVSDAIYKWYNCTEDTSVVVSQNQSFVVKESGQYAVRIIKDGCKTTSECYYMDIPLSSIDNPIIESFKIYPNPTTANVYVNFNMEYSKIEIRVRNILGELIDIFEFYNTKVPDFDIDGPPGLYFIEVKINDSQSFNTMTLIKI